MTDIEAQLRILASGIASVHPSEGLKDKLAEGRPLRVKLGVDPTAPDLHLGHAVPLRKLRQFQELGHQVVLIIGDYTALVGDPSGRNSTRPPLTLEQIEVNAATYMEQAFRILDPEKTELRRNSEWLGPLDMREVLWLTSHVTIARILERDDFSQRYAEQRSISLHEFLYPVMQAYDSVIVAADIEIGGTDQLFNLLSGRELMEKIDWGRLVDAGLAERALAPQVCLTLPLLEGTDGVQKMSKSYGNYVGLTDAPADMFGKVMSIPDELIARYFRLATAVDVDEIDTIESALTEGSAHPNVVKRRLAAEIVALYHGHEAARSAEQDFDRVFKRHEAPEDISEVSVERSDPVYLPGFLRDAGLCTSASAARTLIDDGAVRIDGQQIPKGSYEVAWSEFEGRSVQVGRRRWARPVRARADSPAE